VSSITSIESVARRLDEARNSRLKETKVDFEAYMRARHEDVANIRKTTDFRAEVIDEFFGDQFANGKELPWLKTRDKFLVRPGELTIWTGFNGHMKSMVTGFTMLHLMQQGEKVCIASFEMKPRKTLKRMACQAIATRNPTELYVNKFLDQMEGNLFLYDQQGETSPERILGVVYYCAEQLGVTQFVIDSLMKVVANEDDYNGQKRFISQLCAAAKDLNIHIHLVHHSRKLSDEAKRPGKQDAKGTGAIVDQTDNFITVYKFPRKEGKDKDDNGDPLPTHGLFVDKQRHGEWEGAFVLWFDDNSLQFKETPRARLLNYV
jgi:twinkle protein